MVSGTYAVSMQMPGGIWKGTLTMKETNGRLSGTLKAGDITSSFSNGTVTGNHFTFSGMIRKLFFQTRYTVHGEVNGDILTATADTKYGEFFINGERTG